MINTLQRKISRVQEEIPYQLELIKHAQNLPPLSPQDQKIVDACRRDGVYITTLEALNLAATPTLLATSQQYLNKMHADFSVDYSNRKYAGTADNPVYPYTLTVTDKPEFANWGLEKRLLNIMENYIGLPVTFQGVQLQRDFPNEKQVLTELWHRDAEDRRMIKVIVYLSDVEEEHGPFQCIPKNQVSLLTSRKIRAAIAKASPELGIDDKAMEQFVPRSAWKSCTGRAGTVVFVDPKAVLHHGKPRTKERSTLFFVYTSDKPLHPEFCAVYNDSSFAEADFARPCPMED